VSIRAFVPLPHKEQTTSPFTMKFHAISLIAFSAATLASPVDKRQDGNGPYGPGVRIRLHGYLEAEED
jgi:hypothetical protein